MPRVSIKTDWTSNDNVGLTDLNNIGTNLKYILDENTTFSGVKLFSDAINVAPNIDMSASVGFGKLGLTTGFPGSFAIAHSNNNTLQGYNLLCGADGSTIINAKTGKEVIIRKNNSNVARFTDTQIRFEKEFNLAGNTDTSAILGRGKWLCESDRVFLSHLDNSSTSTYNIAFMPDGRTLINAISGQAISFRNNNNETASFKANSADFFTPINTTGTITTEINDVLAKRNLNFKVAGTVRAYIEFDRHTATGQLTDINFGTMGVERVSIDYSGILHARYGINTDNVTVNGTLKPNVSTNGEWIVAHGSTLVVPRGVYSIQHTLGTTSYSEVQILQGGSWRVVSSGALSDTFGNGTNGDVIFSDGVNVRVKSEGSGGSVVVRYLRF